MVRRKLAAALVLAVIAFTADHALAKCDPAAGWPPGKACRDADQVGLRDGGTDRSLQEAFNSGDVFAGTPCAGDSRCDVLSDADNDGDYGDDFQRILNTFAYANFATAGVANEVVASDAAGYFGLPASDTSAPAVWDQLDHLPIDIQSGGSCSDGGVQVATINADGTITGDVTTSGDTIVDDDIACSATNCVSGSLGVLYLYSPTDWNGLVCSRDGSADLVFTSPSTCSGASVAACSIAPTGALSIVGWSAGTGNAVTCSYESRASNTVVWQTNTLTAGFNGSLSAKWASPPAGTTTCSYTYVTSADGGIDATPITIAPPATPSVIEWLSTVRYCRNVNSYTPHGYAVPDCDGPPSGNDDLPILRWHESWDDTEIHCHVPLAGGGARNYCFKMGDEEHGGTAASTRPGVEFRGAPLLSMTRTPMTPPTDYNYGFWFDGVDESVVKLRTENTGDSDNLSVIFIGDDSLIQLGSRALTSVAPYIGTIYVDGPSSTGLRIGSLPGQELYNHADLYFGVASNGYYDPFAGQQLVSLDTLNGCGYGPGTSDVCDDVTISNINSSVSFIGVPRDIVVVNHGGSFETIMGGILATDVLFSETGNIAVHCRHCPLVARHSWSGLVGSLQQAGPADAFLVSGSVDLIESSGISNSGNNWYSFTTMTVDGYLGGQNGNPINLGPIGAHVSPGLVKFVGADKYEWYIDDLATVSANVCMRKSGSPAYTSVSCTDPDAIFRYSQGKSFLGRVIVELTKDVEATTTECILEVEIAGGCTACTNSETDRVFRIGGQDLWNRNLRDAGDWTMWALNDVVTAGQAITAELRPVSGGTACEAGSGCTCTGVAGLKVTVETIPALYDQ